MHLLIHHHIGGQQDKAFFARQVNDDKQRAARQIVELHRSKRFARGRTKRRRTAEEERNSG